MSCRCLIYIVGHIWVFLATSHDPINANDNLENKSYFWLGLLANLAGLLRPVIYRSILLDIFYPYSISIYGIPLGALNDCWEKRILLKFDVFLTCSEARRMCTSEDPLLTVLYCTCGTYCNNVNILFLFSGEM